MFFLLFILIVMTAYIISFRDDFTKEHTEKIGAFLTLISVLVVVVGVLTSVLRR